MFAKTSVKKPFTVIVGVVMVLLLGIISFSNSTTDLLPKMELPYVVLYTTYPGASAEKVETSLTQVLEASVGTTENLSTMSSVSSDNLSLIILQFADDTNMDTAMINLNAKIDLVVGALDDTVSRPTLMAINPNMMPIMMATVDYGNQDIKELSVFVEQEIAPELEKIKGVASVSVTGMIEETVQIVLDQEKIDEINNKILESVDSELAKTERELREGLKEVNEGLQKINEGQSELGDKKSETIDQLASSTIKLQEAATNLIAMQSQINQLNAEKLMAIEIVNGFDMIYTMLGLPSTATKTDVESEIDSNLDSLNSVVTQVEALISSVTDVSDETVFSPANDPTLAATLSALGITSPIANYGDVKVALETSLNSTKNMISQLNMAKQTTTMMDGATEKLKTIDFEIAAAEAVKQMASSALTSAGIDVSDLSKLQIQLESGKLIAANELTKGEMTITDTKTMLESTKKQLEDGLKQLTDAKEEALKNANISSVITPSMISNMMMAENFSMPAGYIASDDTSILIKVGNEFATLEEVENLILMSMDIDGLEEIRLSDLSEINIVDNSSELYTKVNGNNGIIMSFQKSSTASTAEVCKAIEKRFGTLQSEFDGLRFETLTNQGIYIDMIIQSVLDNFLYGAILAIIVLILFLKDVKPTLVIALSIPISLLFSLVLMYFSNVTLNIISLSGLALGVGMLVDNSVVVVENIYRLRNEGMGIIKASIEGAKEVSGAIIASTLTTVCVFLPIVFATGLAKQLFVDMGLTIAYSLLASLIVALTVVPMLSSKLLTKSEEKKSRWYEGFVKIYTSTLAWSLKHKAIVMCSVSALLVFSFYAAFNMGMTLIPSMNSGQITVQVTVTDENATEKDSQEIYDQAVERILTVEGVETVAVTTSSSGMMSLAQDMTGPSSQFTATFYVLIDKKADAKKIDTAIPNSLEGLPVTGEVSSGSMDLSALGGSGISITLYGDDLDDLQKSATSIGDQLKKIEGIDEVDDGQSDPTKEIRVIVDKNAAMKYGLTVAQVYQKIATGIKSETSSTTLSIQNKNYPVVIIQDDTNLITLQSLRYTVLDGTKDQKAEEIDLWEIAKIEEGTGMASINRENSRRYTTVNATIKEGYNVSLVSREVEKQLDTSALPAHVEMVFAGENESIMETMNTMVLMILLAIVFIYMIMVAQFQSLLSPFIVMFTIPLAFTGGFLGLLVTGQELSIVAMLGFLVLCGVVVNNGIVFIDYANQLRAKGLSVREALTETGRTRLRPILMTALTTILAMTTMALGIGTGSEMMQGMAIVTIGGLTYSTLLTLYVIPIMYELFNKNRAYKIIDESSED